MIVTEKKYLVLFERCQVRVAPGLCVLELPRLGGASFGNVTTAWWGLRRRVICLFDMHSHAPSRRLDPAHAVVVMQECLLDQ